MNVGTRVKIKGKNITGTIISIDGNFAEVNFDNKNEWIRFTNLEDISDELINRMLTHNLDDHLDFILGIDAHRLITEYRFNPYVLASSTKIQIFPHQIDEVSWALDNPKIMIADEVGLGKTIIAALVASELKARGLAKKALYVVPKSLVLKWQDELDSRFEADTKILDSSFVKTNPDPFSVEEFSYITSMDFLKQEHVMKLINRDLDLVVVDEAHKFKMHTSRMALGEKLASRANVLIFLTATPHDGRDDDFLARIRLLNPYVNDVASSSYLWTRNVKENVCDINGYKVFPDRSSETIEVPITERERLIHRQLDHYNKARFLEAQNSRDQNAARFLSHIFRKRGTSSFAALRISLKRRLEKLKTATSHQLADLQAKLEQADDDNDMDYEDFAGEVESITIGHDSNQEKEDLTELIDQIENLGDTDSKLTVLENSIKKLKIKDKNTKILIFTEYRDTLEYLKDRLSQKYRVDRIDGTMKIGERQEVLKDFSMESGPEILICTDAAGEGIDMQFCNIEFNYDIPWNPNKLEQRLGRIHRIGQRRNVFYKNFVVDREKSIDGLILGRLLDKIESMKKALGDKIYDLFGQILDKEEFERYYDDLVHIPEDQWKSKLVELEETIEKKKDQVIKERDLLLTGHKLDSTAMDNISNIRKKAVDIGEVKRFLMLYIDSNEGSFQPTDSDRYRIIPPNRLARSEQIGSFEGTFDSDLAIKNNWPYLALGHKEINKIIKYAAASGVTSLKHPTKTGMIFVYKTSINDGNGKEKNARIVALFHNADAAITEIDPRSLWDYEMDAGVPDTRFIVESKQRADDYLDSIVRKFVAKTQNKFDVIMKKTKDAALVYSANKTMQLDARIDEYQKKIKEEPAYEGLITRSKNEIKSIKKNVDARLESIKKEFVALPSIKLIGIASVSAESGANARLTVERAGMKAVMQDEQKRAETEDQRSLIKDVSESDAGYDIDSFDRRIEVKSFATNGSPSLTSHEWDTSQRYGEEYWLYVVKNATTSPVVKKIQDPYKTCKDHVREEEATDRRIVIDDWEKFAT